MTTDKHQYRIKFYESAEVRVDPFEFAWLLSKHDISVVAKNDRPVLLFVQCDRDSLAGFVRDVNRQYGPLIFKDVEIPQREFGGFESVLDTLTA
ncbi:MAG: hypothetical protein IKE22_04485 [Atopobiaceae bacterium]|nr:hypothetical protein [Atopobiaceae bacterium]